MAQHELRRDKVSVPGRVVIWRKVLANRTGAAPFRSLGALLSRLADLDWKSLGHRLFVESR